jgi:hypothetical protein
MENERPELPIPPEVRRRLDTWRPLWRVFLWLHYTLGVVGVLSSALAAALPVSWLVTLFAVVSACCFAMIGFVSPERRYLGLIRAWRTLDFAATQYKNGLLSLEELLAWLKRREEVATAFYARASVGTIGPPPSESSRTSEEIAYSAFRITTWTNRSFGEGALWR